MTVRATFAFYNLGGAPATGLRVRFSLPEGLRYLVGSAKIDDVPLDEPRGETALLSASGAEIGDVAPGVERRISIGYLVAPAIENNAIIELQAALASFEIPVVGSNIVRLVAKSTPELQNSSTVAILEAVREAQPGSELRVMGRVYNGGQSSARDVVVVLPVPEYTSYIAGSARIDGREIAVDERGDPFGFAYAPVAAPTLAAGATVLVEYRARIDAPLPDGTRIALDGAVASAETPEFALAPVELAVRSRVDVDTDETALTIDAGPEVEPGQRLQIGLAVANAGTTAAESIRVRFLLPESMRVAPGSRTIDGLPVTGESDTAFAIDEIAAGERAGFALDAYVVSPLDDGLALPIRAELTWDGGSRTYERALTVRSRPRFEAARNRIDVRGTPAGHPGEAVTFAVRVVNEGTTAAHDAILELAADASLEELHVEGEGELFARNPQAVVPTRRFSLDLGSLAPFAVREIRLGARIASPVPDRTDVRLAATLATRETGNIPLGAVAITVRSRPRFTVERTKIVPATPEPLRPDRAIDLQVSIVNEGSDVARDVRVPLAISPEARLEGVDGEATRDGNVLIFGDVPAGVERGATIRVRLARFVPRGNAVTIDARLVGVGLLPLALPPVALPTYAEPAFAQGAAFLAQPPDVVEAGEAIYFLLAVRNTGDGTARRLTIRVQSVPNTSYVPGTTSINDVPLLDVAGGSMLWSSGGLVLEDVDPGVEAYVRWRAIVNVPLPTGTAIEAHADLEWEHGNRASVALSPVRVRSAPAFAVRSAELPFGIAGIASRSADAENDIPIAPAPHAPSPVDVTPAAPAIGAVPRAVPIAPALSEAPVPAVTTSSTEPVVAPSFAVAEPAAPQTELVFDEARLSRTLRLLEQVDYGGLIPHLFAIRAFFPGGLVGGDETTQGLFDDAREQLRGLLDRLFIKVRLPRFAVTGKDLEDRPARTALLALTDALIATNPSTGTAQSGFVRVSGTIDRDALRALRPGLESAPLGAVAPWRVLALLSGERAEVATGQTIFALATYRAAAIGAFVELDALPIAEFHRVLTANSNADLDAALRDAMRAFDEVLGGAPVAERA